MSPGSDPCDALAGVGVTILWFHLRGFHHTDNGRAGGIEEGAEGIVEVSDLDGEAGRLDEVSEGFNDDEFGVFLLGVVHDLREGQAFIHGGEDWDFGGVDVHCLKCS